MRTNDKAIENGAVAGRLGGSVMGTIGKGDPEKFDRGAMFGNAFGMLLGLVRPKETDWILQIPQDTVHVLTLQAPITFAARIPTQPPTLPASSVPATERPQSRVGASNLQP
jgi:hypothetical protein